MKLLMVSPGGSLELGAQQVAETLSLHLRRLGHDVELWAPSAPPQGQWPWFHRRTQGQELTRYLRAHRYFDAVDTFPVLCEPKLVDSSLLLVRSAQPDLLYLNVERHALLARPWSPRTVFHLVTLATQASRVRRAYRIADRIVALGSLERAWIADNFPAARGRLASYVVAPPPEDRRRLAEVRNERQSPGRGRRFLWLGRWAPHKGTERLLEWANGHLVANPQDRLTIAGCGEVPSRDVSRLSAFGDRVRWLARFRRAQLPELLGQHDCGLFTSVVEGWGLSLNEMLESGMTVYATDAGGATELRPYFPRQLQQFPPTLEKRVEPALDDIEKSGYLARWNWDRIAEDYQGELVAGRADLGQAS